MKRFEVWLSGLAVPSSLVLWPVSMLTFARGEPKTVLSLTWLGLAVGCLCWWKTCRVHRDQDDGD